MRYLIAFLSLLALANAQFGGFFDQMFGDGPNQGQQQRHSNNPSDAGLYRQRYDQGNTPCSNYMPANGGLTTTTSPMRQISLSRHTRLRSLPPPLSLRVGCTRGQVRTRGRPPSMPVEGRIQAHRCGAQDGAGEEGTALA